MSVRLAFIGAGGIASTHLEHLQSNEHADVTAVCDINPDAAEKWAQAHDAEAYTDWELLFDDGGFDAVFVCVPPFAHEGQELRAAQEGVHLFVEKPLGLDQEYPAEVLDAVQDAGIITQVGHHMRYLETVQRAREHVSDRTLATVYGKWVGGVPGGEDFWWRHRDRSGGQVVEQSTHIFDLVRYFGGDVQQVSSEGDLRVRTDLLDFPDAVSATLRHESGLPSHVMTTAASPTWENGITLVGDGILLSVDPDTCEGVVDDEEVHFEADDDGHHTEVDAFVNAVRENDPGRCRSPYSDAIRTFEVTLAVTNAVTEDRPVPVDQ
ncbi:MAG: Gfo/Idh/MocA family protein [Halobacteriales archaeon]